MLLSHALAVLASERATRTEINRASLALLDLVSRWARGYLSRVAPCRLDESDVDETVQHLLVRASLGTSRFRGTTEGEAMSFCMRVLANKARDLCRHKRRFVTGRSRDEEGADPIAEVPDEKGDAFGEIEMEHLVAVASAMEEAVWRLHRAQDARGLAQSLRCHIEARLGAKLEEQVAKYAPPDDPSAAARTRANNRVYQYRNRGKKAGCGALAALVAEGRYTHDEIAGVARILGCDCELSEGTGAGSPERKVN